MGTTSPITLSGSMDIVTSMKSRIPAYFNPAVNATYARANRCTNTGTSGTSIYYSCPHAAGISVSGASAKVSFSFWYQPVSYSGQGEVFVAKGSLASGNGIVIYLVSQGNGTYKMRVIVDLAWAIITPVLDPAGHFLITIDTSLGASWAGQIKVYQNGTLIDTSTYTNQGTPGTSLGSGTQPLTVGWCAGVAYNSFQVANGAFSSLQLWNVALSAGDATTLYNGGTPLTHSQLGALDNANLLESWDFQTTYLGSESTTRFTGSKNSNVLTPQFVGGAETAVASTQWLLNLPNLGYAGGAFVSRFGNAFELLDPAIRSNLSTGLFDKATIRSHRYNASTCSTHANSLQYSGGSITQICNHTDGDCLIALNTVSTGSGLLGTTNLENWFLEAKVSSTKYTILGITPTTDPSTAPMLPAIRGANPPTYNGGNYFANAAVNVVAGNKDIHHFSVPVGNASTAYTRVNLSTGAETAGVLTANNSGYHPWWNGSGTPTDMFIGGHFTGATYDGQFGVMIWGTKWAAGEATRLRTWMKKIYS